MKQDTTELQAAFEEFQKAWDDNSKTTKKSASPKPFETAEEKEEESEFSKNLKEVLRLLKEAGYDRRDTYVNLDIEPLTYDRWDKGFGGMKPSTYRDFCSLVQDVIAGKNRHLVTVNGAGINSLDEVLAHVQDGDRIWRISAESESSMTPYREIERNLLRSGRQATLVNIVPQNSLETAQRWFRQLLRTSDGCKGHIINVVENDPARLPWFMPGHECILIEHPADQQRKYSEFEGFTGIPVGTNHTHAMGLSGAGKTYITMDSSVTEELYDRLDVNYKKQISELEERAADEGLTVDKIDSNQASMEQGAPPSAISPKRLKYKSMSSGQRGGRR